MKLFRVTYIILFLFLPGACLLAQPDKQLSPEKKWTDAYSEIEPFVSGIARVKKNGWVGVVNEEGKVIVPVEYAEEDLLVFDKGFIAYRDFESDWGLKDKNGKEIFKPFYGGFSGVHKDMISVNLQGAWGLYSLKGKQILPCIFSEPVDWEWNTDRPGTGLVKMQPMDTLRGEALAQTQFGLIHSKGKFILPAVYDRIEAMGNSYYVAYLRGKAALFDLGGDSSIGFRYDEIYLLDEKEKRVVVGQGKYVGISDMKGHIQLPIQFDYIYAMGQPANSDDHILFGPGLYKVSLHGLHGIMRKDLTYFCEPKYQKLESFVYGLAPFQRDQLWGFMDTLGHEVIGPKYDEVQTFYQYKYASVKRNNLWGLVDRNGNEIVPCYYDATLGAPNGRSPVDVYKNGKYGLLDTAFKLWVPCLYDERIHYIPGRVRKNGKFGYINSRGKELTAFIFDEMQSAYLNEKGFHYYAVRQGNLWGFVSNTGKPLFVPQFEAASSDAGITYWVKKNGLWGYINSQGKIILKCEYDEIINIHLGLLAVKKEGKFAFADSIKGKILFAPRFENVMHFGEGYLPVMMHAKWGYSNKQGGLLIPCVYDDVRVFHEGLASVKIFGKWGFIDKNGTMVIPPRYDDAGFFENGQVMMLINGRYEKIDKSGKRLEY